MAGMNVGRVIAGGIAAGIVINVVEGIMNTVVLGDAMRDMYAKMGVQEPAGSAIVVYMVLAFVLGFVVAWVYAAVRPRLGAGPRTAAIAGIVVWLTAGLVPVVGWYIMGMLTTWLLFVFLGYTLVELVAGALVAGVIYQEHGPAM
jgi:hypothetical protein